MERWGELARERPGEGLMHRHTVCKKLKPYFMFSNLSSPLLTAIFNLIKEMERWGELARERPGEGLMHRHTACNKLKPYFMFSNHSSSLLTAILTLLRRWRDGGTWRWRELARERAGEGLMHRHTACKKLKTLFYVF